MKTITAQRHGRMTLADLNCDLYTAGYVDDSAQYDVEELIFGSAFVLVFVFRIFAKMPYCSERMHERYYT